MKQDISEKVSDCKSRNDLPWHPNNFGFQDGTMFPWHELTVAQRLRIFRESKELTQAQFAAAIGADPNTDSYGHAERTGNLSRNMAERIYRRWPEIDQGWLSHGLTGNVASATEKRLYEALKGLKLADRA